MDPNGPVAMTPPCSSEPVRSNSPHEYDGKTYRGESLLAHFSCPLCCKVPATVAKSAGKARKQLHGGSHAPKEDKPR